VLEKVGDSQGVAKQQNLLLIIGLCAIAASTMMVEVVLTKFIAFKVFHHLISIIISTVVLSFAASGTYLYMRPTAAGSPDGANWQAAAREAAAYSTSLILAILVFCWVPIDPYNVHLFGGWRILSMPFYFMVFSCPFFFAGLCISRVLAESSIPASRVYVFDLMAAAIAAAATPPLLELAGGYGVIGAAATLGMIAFFAFAKAAGKLSVRSSAAWSGAYLIMLILLLIYPSWAMKTYGFDIRSSKYDVLRDLVLGDFHGVEHTYWNALARIDISRLGWSNHQDFLFGLAPISRAQKLQGRVITVDCGANTRQFVAKGKINDHQYFGDALWASPYIVRPDAQNALVLGGGGGIDIVIAKYFKIPHVDVVEMNPMTYKHVLRGEDDPDAALYQPWLVSTDTTKVTLYHSEARHFCATHPPDSYDVIQASGVDTLTAVASGALAFSDNYLYTYDAVKSYAHVLRPGGVLSLTNWRDPPGYPLRLFVTYLTYLENSGSEKPWRNVVVLGSDGAGVMMKTTPFTEDELKNLRQWCKRTQTVLIFDPDRNDMNSPAVTKEERLYIELASATREQRQLILNSYKYNIGPATDDKPYFYQLEKNENWLLSSPFAYTPIATTVIIAIFALILIILPIKKLGVKQMSTGKLAHAAFFAISGFAFLLFEVAIVQIFSIFVGGPTYALAVVLVAVLAGYSLGSLIAGLLPIRPRTFVALGIALFISNMAACLLLPSAINSLYGLPPAARIATCASITLLLSTLTGIPVPLAMESAKRSYRPEVAWFWGISSAFNALGSACFVLITLRTGIAATLAIVAVLYLFANILFAALSTQKSAATVH